MFLLFEELTEPIIGIFFDVYNELGFGFLEKVYENAMMIRLSDAGFQVVQQQSIRVVFDGQVVGNFAADIIVDRKVILEIKTAKMISDSHKKQLTNYLRATDAQVGLVLNFGPEATFSRSIFTNDHKNLPPKDQNPFHPSYP
jgi:GxxExxY protein